MTGPIESKKTDLNTTNAKSTPTSTIGNLLGRKVDSAPSLSFIQKIINFVRNLFAKLFSSQPKPAPTDLSNHIIKASTENKVPVPAESDTEDTPSEMDSNEATIHEMFKGLPLDAVIDCLKILLTDLNKVQLTRTNIAGANIHDSETNRNTDAVKFTQLKAFLRLLQEGDSPLIPLETIKNSNQIPAATTNTNVKRILATIPDDKKEFLKKIVEYFHEKCAGFLEKESSSSKVTTLEIAKIYGPLCFPSDYKGDRVADFKFLIDHPKLLP